MEKTEQKINSAEILNSQYQEIETKQAAMFFI